MLILVDCIPFFVPFLEVNFSDAKHLDHCNNCTLQSQFETQSMRMLCLNGVPYDHFEK